MLIKDILPAQRPRERLIAHGAQSLSDQELLAIFFRCGYAKVSVLEMANQTLHHYGGLKQLLQASMRDFCARPGLGVAKYAELQASVEILRRASLADIQERPLLSATQQVANYLKGSLGNLPYESFHVLYLDARCYLLQDEESFRGSLAHTAVYPREIVRRALELRAAYVVFAHNHPGGSCRPSAADRELTQMLKQVLHMVEVRVLDHFIVAESGVFSFHEAEIL